MKIVLVGICHKSHDDAIRFLHSIEAAFVCYPKFDLSVIMVDNSGIPCNPSSREHLASYKGRFKFRYIEAKNVGYFPSFTDVITRLNILKDRPDYLILSNVDLKVCESFFTELCGVRVGQATGVIAPRIWNKKARVDMNPKIITRPSKRQMWRYERIYSSRVLNYLYSVAARVKRLFKRSCDPVAYEADGQQHLRVYAPHGAFVVFLPKYTELPGAFEYPVFLFGEEIHIAEQCRTNKLDVYYCPSLKVFDKQHGALGYVSRERKRLYNLHAITYLRVRYFTDTETQCHS